MIETPVCILGAGPGGTTTALQLHAAGIPCVLIDKASFPRDKVCGDGLSGKVLSCLKRIDSRLADAFVRDFPDKLPSYGVSFVSPGRYRMDIAAKINDQDASLDHMGFVSKRVDFDNWMVEQVRQCCSVQFLEEVSIEKYVKQADGWLLEDSSGEWQIRTQLLIIANGAHSSFAKDEGGIRMEPEHYMAGVRAYYEGVEGIHPDQYIELHFLKDFLPGYFWIFPLPDNKANVGIAMLSKDVQARKMNLKKVLESIVKEDVELKERFRGAQVVSTVGGYGLPLGSKRRPLSGHHFLLVGDAASLIDPLTGEGIGNAMQSGRLAALVAQSCAQQNDYSLEALQAYDERIERQLGNEFQLSYRLQKLARYPKIFNWLLKVAGENKQIRGLITSMFYEVDIRKRLTQPSFYFKLLLNR